jgi:hypothetical protein
MTRITACRLDDTVVAVAGAAAAAGCGSCCPRCADDDPCPEEREAETGGGLLMVET